MGRIRARWDQYKYRFMPWVTLNLKKELGKQKSDRPRVKLKSQEEYVNELKDLLSVLQRPSLHTSFKGSKSDFELLHEENQDILLKSKGFQLNVRKSLISEVAGRGVFVDQGSVKAGDIVALYPGTVYIPSQPVLFQSLGNPYVLR